MFRAQEVCELADVQPYVLRTWEAEFPDLGVAKTANGPRVYRRADVEFVLRIKHLILIDGLTLSGARRQLVEERVVLTPSPESVMDADVAALVDGEVHQQLRDVRRGLQWILGVLSDSGVPVTKFVEMSPSAGAGPARTGKSAAPKATAQKAAAGAKPASKSTKAAPRAKSR